MRDVNIRLYSTVYKNNLSYEDALEQCKKGVYKIMLKEGLILEDPKEVFDKDKNDWCIVEITMEALKIMLG